jgi:hypothetical protein
MKRLGRSFVSVTANSFGRMSLPFLLAAGKQLVSDAQQGGVPRSIVDEFHTLPGG